MMEHTIFAVALLGILAMVVDFIPVANVVTDIVSTVAGGDSPGWWPFGLKLASSVFALQMLMPMFEDLTKRTANTWDDGVYAKAKMILAFALELIAAAGAFDPQFGGRIKAITGPRRTRG